jgi:hypothetical protein
MTRVADTYQIRHRTSTDTATLAGDDPDAPAARRDGMASPDPSTLAHSLELVTQERDWLRQALDDARAREQTHLELLRQQQLQIQRLSQGAPAPTPAARRPAERLAFRRKILALVQQHPEGVTREAIEQAVGTPQHLGDLLQGYVRNGHLMRPAKGIYTLPPGPATPSA